MPREKKATTDDLLKVMGVEPLTMDELCVRLKMERGTVRRLVQQSVRDMTIERFVGEGRRALTYYKKVRHEDAVQAPYPRVLLNGPPADVEIGRGLWSHAQLALTARR